LGPRGLLSLWTRDFWSQVAHIMTTGGLHGR
jgi:hypothetical protein